MGPSSDSRLLQTFHLSSCTLSEIWARLVLSFMYDLTAIILSSVIRECSRTSVIHQLPLLRSSTICCPAGPSVPRRAPASQSNHSYTWNPTFEVRLQLLVTTVKHHDKRRQWRRRCCSHHSISYAGSSAAAGTPTIMRSNKENGQLRRTPTNITAPSDRLDLPSAPIRVLIHPPTRCLRSFDKSSLPQQNRF